MNSWVWFAFTATSAEAGKNNECREPNAYGLGPFGLLYSIDAEGFEPRPGQ